MGFLEKLIVGQEGMLTMITFPTPDWIEELKKSYSLSTDFMNPLSKFYNREEVQKGISLQHWLLLKKWETDDSG